MDTIEKYLTEYKQSGNFKKSYNSLTKAIQKAWNDSDTIDNSIDVYADMKKLSKQIDMLTIKYQKAKII